MIDTSTALARQFVLSCSLLAAPTWSSAATIVTTMSPVRVGEVSSTRINLNALLGPVLDTTDDLEIRAQDFGSTAFLIALGIPDAQIAVDGGSLSLVSRFAEGDSIGSDLNFGGGYVSLAWDSSLGSSLGEWSGGASGYLGLSFQIADNTHYGFVRISWFPGGDSGTSTSYAVIDKIGYNSVAGEPALIPEPSTGLLVMFSLASFVLGRRR